MSCHVNCEKTYKRVTHVIFDVDGTMLDSEKYYDIAYSEVCSSYGKVYTNEVHLAHTGCPVPVSCQTIVKMLEIDDSWEEFRDKFVEAAHKVISESALMPGVEKLVNHLSSKGVLLGIATSSSPDDFQLKFAKYEEFLTKFHHYVLTADPEVGKGKPSPDIYLVACKRFPDNPKPSDCLVFEDAVNGVKAARSAGMQCVMIPDKGVPEELRQEATVVLNSMEDFKPELFGLPPY